MPSTSSSSMVLRNSPIRAARPGSGTSQTVASQPETTALHPSTHRTASGQQPFFHAETRSSALRSQSGHTAAAAARRRPSSPVTARAAAVGNHRSANNSPIRLRGSPRRQSLDSHSHRPGSVASLASGAQQLNASMDTTYGGSDKKKSQKKSVSPPARRGEPVSSKSVNDLQQPPPQHQHPTTQQHLSPNNKPSGLIDVWTHQQNVTNNNKNTTPPANLIDTSMMSIATSSYSSPAHQNSSNNNIEANTPSPVKMPASAAASTTAAATASTTGLNVDEAQGKIDDEHAVGRLDEEYPSAYNRLYKRHEGFTRPTANSGSLTQQYWRRFSSAGGARNAADKNILSSRLKSAGSSSTAAAGSAPSSSSTFTADYFFVNGRFKSQNSDTVVDAKGMCLVTPPTHLDPIANIQNGKRENDASTMMMSVTSDNTQRKQDQPQPPHVWVANKDGSFFIYDRRTGAVIEQTAKKDLTCTVMLEVGSYMWCGFADGYIRVLDKQDISNVIVNLSRHNGAVTALISQPGSPYVLSASNDFTILQWDVRSYSYVGRFNGHSSGVRSLTTGINGQHLYSGADGGTIKVWHLYDGVELTTSSSSSPDGGHNHNGVPPPPPPLPFTGHTDSVTQLLFVGGNLWSGSLDGTVKVWNPIEGTCLATLLMMEPNQNQNATDSASATLTSMTKLPPVTMLKQVGQQVWGSSVGALCIWEMSSPFNVIRQVGQYDQPGRDSYYYVDALPVVTKTCVRLWLLRADGQIVSCDTEDAPVEHDDTMRVKQLSHELFSAQADAKKATASADATARAYQEKLDAATHPLQEQLLAVTNENEGLARRLRAAEERCRDLNEHQLPLARQSAETSAKSIADLEQANTDLKRQVLELEIKRDEMTREVGRGKEARTVLEEQLGELRAFQNEAGRSETALREDFVLNNRTRDQELESARAELTQLRQQVYEIQHRTGGQKQDTTSNEKAPSLDYSTNAIKRVDDHPQTQTQGERLLEEKWMEAHTKSTAAEEEAHLLRRQLADANRVIEELRAERIQLPQSNFGSVSKQEEDPQQQQHFRSNNHDMPSHTDENGVVPGMISSTSTSTSTSSSSVGVGVNGGSRRGDGEVVASTNSVVDNDNHHYRNKLADTEAKILTLESALDVANERATVTSRKEKEMESEERRASRSINDGITETEVPTGGRKDTTMDDDYRFFHEKLLESNKEIETLKEQVASSASLRVELAESKMNNELLTRELSVLQQQQQKRSSSSSYQQQQQQQQHLTQQLKNHQNAYQHAPQQCATSHRHRHQHNNNNETPPVLLDVATHTVPALSTSPSLSSTAAVAASTDGYGGMMMMNTGSSNHHAKNGAVSDHHSSSSNGVNAGAPAASELESYTDLSSPSSPSRPTTTTTTMVKDIAAMYGVTPESIIELNRERLLELSRSGDRTSDGSGDGIGIGIASQFSSSSSISVGKEAELSPPPTSSPLSSLSSMVIPPGVTLKLPPKKKVTFSDMMITAGLVGGVTATVDTDNTLLPDHHDRASADYTRNTHSSVFAGGSAVDDDNIGNKNTARSRRCIVHKAGQGPISFPSSTSSASNPSASSVTSTTTTVLPDTLTSIGQKYGVSLGTLLKYNPRVASLTATATTSSSSFLSSNSSSPHSSISSSRNVTIPTTKVPIPQGTVIIIPEETEEEQILPKTAEQAKFWQRSASNLSPSGRHQSSLSGRREEDKDKKTVHFTLFEHTVPTTTTTTSINDNKTGAVTSAAASDSPLSSLLPAVAAVSSASPSSAVGVVETVNSLSYRYGVPRSQLVALETSSSSTSSSSMENDSHSKDTHKTSGVSNSSSSAKDPSVAGLRIVNPTTGQLAGGQTVLMIPGLDVVRGEIIQDDDFVVAGDDEMARGVDDDDHNANSDAHRASSIADPAGTAGANTSQQVTNNSIDTVAFEALKRRCADLETQLAAAAGATSMVDDSASTAMSGSGSASPPHISALSKVTTHAAAPSASSSSSSSIALKQNQAGPVELDTNWSWQEGSDANADTDQVGQVGRSSVQSRNHNHDEEAAKQHFLQSDDGDDDVDVDDDDDDDDNFLLPVVISSSIPVVTKSTAALETTMMNTRKSNHQKHQHQQQQLDLVQPFLMHREQQYKALLAQTEILSEQKGILEEQLRMLEAQWDSVQFIVNTRPSMLRTIYDLHFLTGELFRAANLFKDKISRGNPADLGRRALENEIDVLNTKTGTINSSVRWVIGNLFTDVEVLHLGGSPTHFSISSSSSSSGNSTNGYNKSTTNDNNNHTFTSLTPVASATATREELLLLEREGSVGRPGNITPLAMKEIRSSQKRAASAAAFDNHHHLDGDRQQQHTLMTPPRREPPTPTSTKNSSHQQPHQQHYNSSSSLNRTPMRTHARSPIRSSF